MIGYLDEGTDKFVFKYGNPAILLVRKRELLNEYKIFTELAVKYGENLRFINVCSDESVFSTIKMKYSI